MKKLKDNLNNSLTGSPKDSLNDKNIKIVEVGPRDGLQNYHRSFTAEEIINLVKSLYNAGLSEIEIGSFVSPKAVPQMKESFEVANYFSIHPLTPSNLIALVPNEKGLDIALEAGIKTIAVFAAASETFSQKNINISKVDYMHKVQPLIKRALASGLKVRAYISTIVHCPFEGFIQAQEVLDMAKVFLDLGCYELSLGETIGRARPFEIKNLFDLLCSELDPKVLAAHYHNTYNTALANIYVTLDYGIRTFDSSIGGLGGCPYAPGAAGNIATEDLVYFLNGEGWDTGLDSEVLRKLKRGL